MSSDRRGFLRDLARTAREVKGVSGAGRDAFAEARDALLAEDQPEEETTPERAPDRLSAEERERYAAQLGSPGWSEGAQLALRAASVLVVGTGGLGSPVALSLAAAGVGRLGILDDDRVALADLQAELLHFTPDVGVAKAHSAAAKLGFLNPEVEVVPYEVRLEADNAAGLLVGHDVVVGPPSVNAVLCAAGVPGVLGQGAGLGGAAMAIRPGMTACWRCAGPGLAPAGGTLAAVAGVLGSLMALEAIKLVTGFAPPLTDALLRVELASPALIREPVRRRTDCPDCGEG